MSITEWLAVIGMLVTLWIVAREVDRHDKRRKEEGR